MQNQKYPTQVFGDRLRELCEARGPYSQIARDLGINRQQFAKYLNGTSMPRDAILNNLAEYFDITVGDFFNDTAPAAASKHPSSNIDPTNLALMDWASKVKHEPIGDDVLKPGFYLQYKQSFTQPDKIACMLCLISKDDSGVLRCKRRYSIKVAKGLPTVKATDVSHGVIAKVMGNLILFDIDGIAGDVVVSAFKQSSVFSISDRVKTGIVLTQGRPSNLGPVSGRHIIEHVPENESLLTWARMQGFRDVSELPEYIQYHFQTPPFPPGDVLSVR